VYFADHPGELGEQVRQGRQEFVSQFKRLGGNSGPFPGHDPLARSTFEGCRLHRRPEDGDTPSWTLHRDLLALRLALRTAPARQVDASAPTPDLLLMRRMNPLDDYLIVVNLGTDIDIAPLADPLVAPPADADWHLVWSSEHADYGGSGAPALERDRWIIAGHSTAVLSSSATGDALARSAD
jgi:maltooligosyltrehalose trehalohydrolase